MQQHITRTQKEKHTFFKKKKKLKLELVFLKIIDLWQ